MRVFVTGIGAVSCLGRGKQDHRTAFLQAKSGIALIGERRAGLPSHGWAGLVADQACCRPPGVRSWLGMAIQDAFLDARLTPATATPIYLGSAHGDLERWQQRRRSALSPEADLWQLLDTEWQTDNGRPDMTVVSTACTASSVAAGLAFDAVRSGQRQVAVIAGVESLTTFLYSGFQSLRSLAPRNCTPFDVNRGGLVLGEGAAALILEAEDHAIARGVPTEIELAGFGFASDGVHLTAPDPSGNGAASALRKALGQARLAERPGFINTHGTGTRLNDRMECTAIRRVFGNSAAAIPLTATKPLTGHMCGAAGAMEMISTVISLQTQCVPPVLGLNTPDSDFGDLDFVSGAARHIPLTSAISMNSGFGGTNTAIVLQRNPG